jgi:hypothetical protein
MTALNACQALSTAVQASSVSDSISSMSASSQYSRTWPHSSDFSIQILRNAWFNAT